MQSQREQADQDLGGAGFGKGPTSPPTSHLNNYKSLMHEGSSRRVGRGVQWGISEHPPSASNPAGPAVWMQAMLARGWRAGAEN